MELLKVLPSARMRVEGYSSHFVCQSVSLCVCLSLFTPHAQRERGKVIGRGVHSREYGSTLYVGLARAVSPTNTNFRLTFLLTRLQEALYEDLAV